MGKREASAVADARSAVDKRRERQLLAAFLAIRFPAQSSLVVAFPAPARMQRRYDWRQNPSRDYAAEVAYAANVGHAPRNDVPEAVREQFAYSRRSAKGRALADRMIAEARA